jgi:uncharacterized membrane protein
MSVEQSNIDFDEDELEYKADVRSRLSRPAERHSGNLRSPIQPPAERTGSNPRPQVPTTQPSVPAPSPTSKNSSGSTAVLASKVTLPEFNTAMVHLYRAEIQRANTWRNRLDTTTNWAVLTAGATLSFAFSAPSNPHFVILINSILVAFFLFMEARRYRYYEIWSSRVRIIETGYFAQMLSPENVSNELWTGLLSKDLMTPHFTISMWEAVGRRLRRNYLWIFGLLAVSWNLKVYLHPTPARNMVEFLARASVGIVPGWKVLTFGIVFNLSLLIFAIATLRLREATGEVLPPPHQFSLPSWHRMRDWTRAATANRRRITLRRSRKARARVRTSSVTGEWKKPEKTE